MLYDDLAIAKDNLRRAKDYEQTVKAITESVTPTSGKNAEDRKRELTIALSQDGIYTQALFQLREAEAAVDRAQADVEAAEAERRDREWQIRADLARALAGQGEDEIAGNFQDRQMEQSARLRTSDGGHTLETHRNCRRINCPICEGGLANCFVCHGAEATLPTECPGRPMTEGEQQRVMDGVLDYRNGEWTAPRLRIVQSTRQSVDDLYGTT